MATNIVALLNSMRLSAKIMEYHLNSVIFPTLAYEAQTLKLSNDQYYNIDKNGSSCESQGEPP